MPVSTDICIAATACFVPAAAMLTASAAAPMPETHIPTAMLSRAAALG